MDLTNDVVYVFFPILFLFIFNLLIHIYLTKQRRNMKLIIKNSYSIIIQQRKSNSKNIDSVQTLLSDSIFSKNSSKYDNKSTSKDRNKKQGNSKRNDKLHKNSFQAKNSTSISGIFKFKFKNKKLIFTFI